MAEWICKDCYNKLELGPEIYPISNWINKKCIWCENIARYLCKASMLDEYNFLNKALEERELR